MAFGNDYCVFASPLAIFFPASAMSLAFASSAALASASFNRASSIHNFFRSSYFESKLPSVMYLSVIFRAGTKLTDAYRRADALHVFCQTPHTSSAIREAGAMMANLFDVKTATAPIGSRISNRNYRGAADCEEYLFALKVTYGCPELLQKTGVVLPIITSPFRNGPPVGPPLIDQLLNQGSLAVVQIYFQRLQPISPTSSESDS